VRGAQGPPSSVVLIGLDNSSLSLGSRCAAETVGRLASWWRESAAVLFGCASQGGIRTDECDRPAGRQGARQMDSIVASQGEPFGEFAGVARKARVDPYP
jgi:hypothetical protein